MTVLTLSAAGQTYPKSKVFVSRGGWEISYPADWRIESCHACKDPREPGVYVDFFAPEPNQGWVMVEPLAEKPFDESTDSWLAKMAETANVNPHLHEERIKVNEQPSLKVRYRTSTGQQMEEVYVLSNRKTFKIEFSGDLSNQGTLEPLETLRNYQTYLKMLRTFKVQHR
jgi:hypothetical protein